MIWKSPAWTKDGNEHKFDLDPESEEAWGSCHQAILAAHNTIVETGSDDFLQCTVTTAPEGEGDKCVLKSMITEWKKGKEE